MQQIQKELHTLIYQEFHNSDVYHITTALIRAGINVMPSVNTQCVQLLDNERESLSPQVTKGAINYFWIKLQNKQDQGSSIQIQYLKYKISESCNKPVE